eukprot:c7839_g1_i1.p1 GENE.c7839_g1_i1~~c7839_g1_i1.p1  ORF type:complete len:229 (+),score=72.80 c7839_g1_i1:251-937(+)
MNECECDVCVSPSVDALPLRMQPVAPSFGSDTDKRDTWSADDTFSVFQESGGLRPMFIPGELVDSFTNMAKQNTLNNRETCGLLMGKMTDSGWQVTHLFVPPQKGTSDNCETYDEMKVFNAQIALEVVTLGWMHTHPSQTNFLSSVDLHTQYVHQLMLPEAVAIVIAPTDKTKVATYTIPVPEAMAYLSKCRLSGFHEHRAAPPLFRHANHVTLRWNTTTPFEILDLR